MSHGNMTRNRNDRHVNRPSKTVRRVTILGGAILAVAGAYCAASDKPPVKAPKPSTKPAGPKSNLDLWLTEDAGKKESKTGDAARAGASPFGGALSTSRPDALPGVVELSDGRILAGGLYTTVEKPWVVFVQKEARWRRVPFITALSVTAVVVSEKTELRWRWKAMGEPEKVYTGKTYPTRRFLWTFRLLDGSTLTGAVKGQPLWVEHDGKRQGPFVLHERSRGADGQSLKDLVYVKRIIVSRRLMTAVLDARAKAAADNKNS